MTKSRVRGGVSSAQKKVTKETVILEKVLSFSQVFGASFMGSDPFFFRVFHHINSIFRHVSWDTFSVILHVFGAQVARSVSSPHLQLALGVDSRGGQKCEFVRRLRLTRGVLFCRGMLREVLRGYNG